MDKPCSKCGVYKPLEDFHKASKEKSGKKSACKVCLNKQNIEYRKRNKVAIKEYSKTYYQKNKEIHLKRCRDWQKRNPVKVSNNQKRYYKKIENKLSGYRANRRARKLNATPSWANLERIAKKYEFARFMEKMMNQKYHVDHVIPLQGKTVCGLHVESNLQILLAKDNLRKHNKFEGVI